MECRTCEFFRRKPELPEGTGQCLSNPPAIVVVDGKAQAMYPAVEAEARCRHWREIRIRLNPDSAIPGLTGLKESPRSRFGTSSGGRAIISPALQPQGKENDCLGIGPQMAGAKPWKPEDPEEDEEL